MIPPAAMHRRICHTAQPPVTLEREPPSTLLNHEDTKVTKGDKPNEPQKRKEREDRKEEKNDTSSLLCVLCALCAFAVLPGLPFVSSWLPIQAVAAVAVVGTSRVQKGQTLALSGMLLRQCGQSRVVGSVGSSVLRRLMR